MLRDLDEGHALCGVELQELHDKVLGQGRYAGWELDISRADTLVNDYS